jgi:hypothetical protein
MGFAEREGGYERRGYFKRMVEGSIPPYEDTCELLRKRLIKVGSGGRLFLVADRMRRSSSCKIQELSTIMDGSRRLVDGGSISRKEGMVELENEKESLCK